MAKKAMQPIESSSLPPLPKAEKRVLKQAEINEDLWREVEVEVNSQGITNREAFEYGLRCFLAASRLRK